MGPAYRCPEQRPKRTAKQLVSLFHNLMKKEVKTAELGDEETEEDDDSGMDEWEVETINRFMERVQKDKEERDLEMLA